MKLRSVVAIIQQKKTNKITIIYNPIMSECNILLHLKRLTVYNIDLLMIL